LYINIILIKKIAFSILLLEIVLRFCHVSGAVVIVIVWLLDLQLAVQSVPITINVVVASRWFSQGTLVSFTNKTDLMI
jgi:hypothetical protein